MEQNLSKCIKIAKMYAKLNVPSGRFLVQIHYVCVEVTLTRLYQKTKRTHNGRVLDVYRTKRIQTGEEQKTSNGLVCSITAFVHVKKCQTYLPNINGHGMYTLNVNHIENGH